MQKELSQKELSLVATMIPSYFIYPFLIFFFSFQFGVEKTMRRTWEEIKRERGNGDPL